MGKGAFWLGKGADTDSRQERIANLTLNRFEVSESYMKHLEDESKENKMGNQKGKQYLAVKEEDEEESRGSNMESVPGFGRRAAVKSEEIDDSRIRKMYDPEIQRMYREGLPENRDDSTDESTDSSGESSCERCMEAYEELIREFPEMMEVVEEERKEREREETHREAIGKTRNARTDCL